MRHVALTALPALASLFGPVTAVVPLTSTGPGVDAHGLLRQHVESDPRGGTAIVAVVVETKDSEQVRRVHAYGGTRGRPVDEQTLFEIGSITKVFTSMLLADMVRRGEVTLETTVEELLPEISADVELSSATGSISLGELATHTSGLPRLSFGPGMLFRAVFRARDPYAGTEVEDLFRALEGVEPKARGEMLYSNLGVAVLGHLLAARAGRPYDELLGKRVLRPLGLGDTWVGVAVAPPARVARGHGDNGRPAVHWNMDAYAPSGGVVSSAADMGRFLEQRLETPGPIWRFRPAGGATAAPVRLGWLEAAIGDDILIWHNGATGGFRSFIGLLPERRRGTVVLSNGSVAVDALGRWLLGDETVPEPLPTPVFWSAVTAGMMLLAPLGLAGSWRRIGRGRRRSGVGAGAPRTAFQNRWHYLASLAGYAFVCAVFVRRGTWVVLPYWTAYVSAGLAVVLAMLLLPEVRRLEWRGTMRRSQLALAIFATFAYASLVVLFVAW